MKKMTWPPLWLWVFILAPRIWIYHTVLKNPSFIMSGDSLAYIQLAKHLWFDHQFVRETAAGWVSETYRIPGYPLFLAAVLGLFHGSLLTVIGIQAALGAFSCVALWFSLLVIGGRRGALVGTTFFSLDAVNLLHTSQILTETLFCTVLIVALGLTWRSILIDPKQAVKSAWVWSVASFIKPIGLYWPALVSIIWIPRRKTWALFLVAAYLLPAAWVLRNKVTSGYFGYTVQMGGALLDFPGAAIEAMRTGRSMDETAAELKAQVDKRWHGHSPTMAEQSAAYGSLALDLMKRHPLLAWRWFQTGALRILTTNGLELVIQLLYPQEGLTMSQCLQRHRWLIAFQILYLIFLLGWYALFGIGCWTFWRRGDRRVVFVLIWGCLYFIAVASAFGYHRFRIPLLPFLAAGAAAIFPVC